MITNDIKEQISTYLGGQTRVTLVGPLAQKDKNFAPPVIYVDGGAHSMDEKGLTIGDGDSYDGPIDIRLCPNKDISDLGFVLENLPLSIQEVHLIGFMGGRKDHEMFNLGEVSQFLNHRNCRVFFDDAHILAYSPSIVNIQINDTFSVMVFEEAHISIKGECKFQTKGIKTWRPLSSYGLSNEGYGDIKIQSDKPFFIFLSHEL